MKFSLFTLFILSFAVPVCAETQERSDWGSVFEKYEVQETIIVVDGREKISSTSLNWRKRKSIRNGIHFKNTE